jgi:hypothetical protein
MVTNSARKKAATAHAQAAGLPYTAAARHTDRGRDGTLTAIGVHTDLMQALQRAGWPTEYETIPENVQYRGYAGPARLTVGRADQVTSFGGDDPDPDDSARLDLAQPPRVEMAAPLLPTGFEAHSKISGDRPTGEVVAELARMLTDGRSRAIAQAANGAGCAVCGDAYPRTHLLAATGEEELPRCPVCAFDGDVFVTGAHATAYLTYQIDQLAATDLATPAGWAGPTALLGCAAPDGFGDRLHAMWRESGTLLIPSEQWSQPEQIWVWLPPTDRPAPLDRFGPGARLGALVAALDEQVPDLRQRARDMDAENWREAGLDDDEPVPDRFLDQIWPAAVAYAVSFCAQAVERAAHRPPLQHLLGSFDSLRDHLTLIDSPLDFDDIESTLGVGIDTITSELWPDRQYARL